MSQRTDEAEAHAQRTEAVLSEPQKRADIEIKRLESELNEARSASRERIEQLKTDMPQQRDFTQPGISEIEVSRDRFVMGAQELEGHLNLSPQQAAAQKEALGERLTVNEQEATRVMLEQSVKHPGARENDLSATRGACRKRRSTAQRLIRAAWRKPWLQPLYDSLQIPWLTVRFGLPGALRILRRTARLRASRLFDVSYYLDRYDDIDASGMDPVLHYIAYGARENRDPSANFSTRAYLARYPDVGESGIPALLHYALHGRQDRRIADFAQSQDGAGNLSALNPYFRRPDDMVAVEAARGEEFLARHGLLGDAPDFMAAIDEINNIAPDGAPLAPAASIIVPVYGQLAYTLNTLHSLAQHSSIHTFEVIVVDDCSQGDVAQQLSQIPWIRLETLPVNQGFVMACNHGATLANGQYIVLLNNDTRVVGGWLDELLDTFSRRPEAGLVGSKLFYPDGSLQESGGILWQDGSAWTYGRGDDPGRPEYCYARQVDYVSGASIAIPTSLWNAANGFDEYFRPAYGEDSDLALRIRHELGREVWVQPLSRVIHYEGKTSGTDVRHGVKAHQITNAEKLRMRWADVLARHRPNAVKPLLEKDRMARRRALVIDAITPEIDKDAGSLTCFEIMRALQANGYKVSFAPQTNMLFLPERSQILQRHGIEALYAPYSTPLAQHLEMHGDDYDVVVIFRVGIAAKCLPDVKRHCSRARIIFHTSDLHFIREMRAAELSGSTAEKLAANRTRDQELMIISAADATIVHSTYEQEELAKIRPRAIVRVFPWILDSRPVSAGFAERNGIAFLGGYGHSPNVDAVKYFIEQVWPLVQAQVPEMKFIIAGSQMPPELAAFDGQNNIEARGFIPDLDSFFEEIRLTVAPIRYGAGIKGKVAMSLAHGVPVVCTPCAAEGMALGDGSQVLIAEEPGALAGAVIKLYQDSRLWAAMSRNGQEFVDATYGTRLGHRIMGEIITAAKG